MKKYDVREIAILLNVDEETVRRWIRSGSLRSTIGSKKKGYTIDETDLYEFVNTRPKYRARIGFKTTIEHRDDGLNELLLCLTRQRDILNEYIDEIQSLLEEF